MVRTRTVGKKGQVTIPKEIRDRFGLKEGKKVIFEVKGDEIILRPEKAGKDYVEEFTSVIKKKLEAPNAVELKRLYYGQIEERLY
ncbi:transcriptional regulator, AbrB family [Geoglobus ahangari]|uniref:Transcriptional regulator, AbrB family n=1 Tax=Geoglobus ahangari TaxID=113653 RepID=A0A0F7IEL9_9EURY|nr:AbrB/MazE/SpoVT family DNA-binding domain-containing protein [Geoglobus ahangari]AKG92014.1 transcriptional regulator, AbrB family [Geoglobus ahangari]